MTTKAIITQRNTTTSGALEAANQTANAATAGLNVEQTLPQGALVKGSESQYRAIESQGFRVKLLTDTNILEVGSYRIDTEAGPPKVPAKQDVPSAEKSKWTHHLVQLSAPPNENWVNTIEQQGIDVVEPISAYGLFVVGEPDEVKKLENLPFVEWTGPFKPAYRLSPGLKDMKGTIQYVSIGVYPLAETPEVRTKLENAGGKIKNESTQRSLYNDEFGVLLVEIKADALPGIATLPPVRWLEFQGPPKLADERSDQIIAENLNTTAAPGTGPVPGYQASVMDPVTGLGLSGAGVTIGICDSGVDNHNNTTMHPDLRNRMAFFADVTGGAAPVDIDGHGTHVAGIAVGNATTGETDPQGFLLGLGMASGSQFGSINAITGLAITSSADWVKRMTANGVNVMNNSWEFTGTAGGPYSASAREFDQMVRDPDPGTAGLQNLTIVFASANNGSGLNTVSTPANAKNLITVGNSLSFRPAEGDLDDIRGLNTKSGRGLSSDGRILPTIVAPGTTIISARSDFISPGKLDRDPYTDTSSALHNRYMALDGTSMAAPHISGLCALLIEWWRNRTGGRTPSPALLKAMLINGAIDCAGGDTRRVDAGGNPILIAPIPNGDQGWGRVSLPNMVVQAPDSDRGPKIFSDQRHAFTANAQEFTIRVAPVDETRPMRVTLVWTDAAGAVNANPALVNDLDLEVTEIPEPGVINDVYKGNVFANGFSVTGGAFDNRNNTECVYLDHPGGLYDITVIAANIAASARPDITTPWQDFALVIDNAEVASADPVSVVPVIDRSGSMIDAGYVDVTKTSSKQFVDLMSLSDNIGVVSFGTTSTVEYPTGPGAPPLQDIYAPTVKDAVKERIDAISFGGNTFMGAGINAGRDMLSSAAGARAMVLLSDGYDNKGGSSSGPSALEAVDELPDNMPIYSCAMGPLSDQALLEQIAGISGGQYYYMPAIDDLFEIYNYIRGRVTGDSIIVNTSAMASSNRVTGFVDPLATEATFTVAWANTALQFTPDDPKKTTDISIKLRDPRGKLLHRSDTYVRRTVGEGYVVFKIQEPMAGEWSVEVSTVRKEHTKFTAGGFVKSPLRLLVSFRPRIIARSPLHIGTEVYDGGRKIAGFRAATRVIKPDLSIPNLLSKFKSQLRNIQVPAGGDILPPDIAKLAVLREIRLKAKKDDIFAHIGKSLNLRKANIGTILPPVVRGVATSDALPSGAGGQAQPAESIGGIIGAIFHPRTGNPSTISGTLVGQFTKTEQTGSYNVVVEATGTSPVSGARFVRKDMVSVRVK